MTFGNVVSSGWCDVPTNGTAKATVRYLLDLVAIPGAWHCPADTVVTVGDLEHPVPDLQLVWCFYYDLLAVDAAGGGSIWNCRFCEVYFMQASAEDKSVYTVPRCSRNQFAFFYSHIMVLFTLPNFSSESDNIRLAEAM